MSRRWHGPLRGASGAQILEKLGQLEKALPFHEHYDDVRLISADYTMDPKVDFTDHYSVDVTAAVVLTLPDSRLYLGRCFYVTRVAGEALITGNHMAASGQLINGGAAYAVVGPVWTTAVFKSIYNAAGGMDWIASATVA